MNDGQIPSPHRQQLAADLILQQMSRLPHQPLAIGYKADFLIMDSTHHAD